MVKKGNELRLYIDGKRVKTTTGFDANAYDLNNNQPLLIGFGQSDYFSGQINELRIYRKAIGENDIATLFSSRPQ